MLAVNDLNALVPPEAYGSTLRKILDRLNPRKTRVFVGNVPDLSMVPIYARVPKVLLDQRVGEYNAQIEEAAGEKGAVLVDLFETSRELAVRGGSFISQDGFHPSEQGYSLIADAFWDAISNDDVIGPRVSRSRAFSSK